MAEFTLEDLAKIVAARARFRRSRPPIRRSSRGQGVAQCAKKLGEEAVEAAIAAVKGDREGLKAEAADVLYHLLVLLDVTGVPYRGGDRGACSGGRPRPALQEKARRTGA